MVLSSSPEALVIVWDPVTGVNLYRTTLYLRGEDTVVMGVDGLGNSTTNNATLSNLTAGALYDFEVCGINDAGETCSRIPVNGCEMFFVNYHLFVFC